MGYFYLVLHFVQLHFTTNLLTFIGGISYDLYLIQEIVHRYAFVYLWNTGMGVLFFVMATILFMILLSFFIHHTIEKPLISFGNRIEKYIC